MKNLILTFALCIINSLILEAQIPPKAYRLQGVATNINGVVRQNTNISYRVSILKDSPTGGVVYDEEGSTSTDASGVFGLNIGEREPNEFSAINWGNHNHYIRLEIDPNGGNNYQAIGETQQILSVPYATVAQTVQQKQQLQLDGNQLAISGGNQVDLSSVAGSTQTLSFNNNNKELTISEGNTVNLSPLVADGDSNPNNELQNLSLSGTNLSLSQGGGNVNLSSFNPIWDRSGSTAFYSSRVEIRGGSSDLEVGDDIITDHIGLYSGTFGSLEVLGENDKRNFLVGTLSGNNNHGWLGIYNSNGDDRARFTVLSTGAGFVGTIGPNGNSNVQLTTPNNLPNNGYALVFDSQGNRQAGMWVNSSNQGIVFGDDVGLLIDTPEEKSANGNQVLRYSVLGGGEAAAYHRGSANLENGEIFVAYPEHYKKAVNTAEVTVMLTPTSANTYGLAVIERTTEGFRVKELMNGTGNFEFFWEVKGVRKGWEKYEVYMDDSELEPSVESEVDEQALEVEKQ